MTTQGGIVESGLLLRPVVAADAERWLEMLGDPDYRRYATPEFLPLPTDVGDLAERIAGSSTAWAEGEPGTLVAVAEDAPDRLLGDIAWRWSFGEKLAIADLGYGTHPDARGRGVGRRSIIGLTRWLMSPEGRGLERVQLDHSTENAASCRVALAAGFVREGIRPGYLPLRDPEGVVRRHDVCLHGRITPP